MYWIYWKYDYLQTTYSGIHQPRRFDKNGGSLVIYIHDALTFAIRRNLSINNSNIEAFWIEIIKRKDKNILISAQYIATPGNYNDFEA